MKIKDFPRNHTPIVLGNLGIELKSHPKLTDEQILAQQPASTQRLMKMTDVEHAEFHASEIKYLKMETDPHKLRPDLINEDGEYTQKAEAILNERRERKILYRHDKTTLIHPDNKNGDLELEGINKDRKYLAEKAFEYHRPEIDPLSNEPFPPEVYKKPKSLWDWVPYSLRGKK